MTGIVLCVSFDCYAEFLMGYSSSYIYIVNELIYSGGVRFMVIVRIKVQFRDYSSGIAIRSYFKKNKAMFHRLNQVELEQLRSSYKLL